MEMHVEEIEDGIKRVTLDGRLDIDGERAINQEFTFATMTRAERGAVRGGVDPGAARCGSP